VFNTVLETGDHGSFNSWGRDRFWTPDINETSAEVEKQSDLPKLDMLEKNIIRHSRWRCDHGWDIDLDDGSTWYRIYNNVLLNRGLKMREGYDRMVTNNIILNNSLHPHVWYPNSGDVFVKNIVFGAYKPAIMNRGIAEDGQWGTRLDSNLFATVEEDRLKFARNSCDAHSLAGDPLFLDAKNGDYRVEEGSPALDLGFVNFPMNEFGVVSENLREIAKQPELPVLITSARTKSGLTYPWFDVTVKNVETEGEQSAAGLPSLSGVILLEVPGYSKLHDQGFRTGQVIVAIEDTELKDYAQLKQMMSQYQYKKDLDVIVFHNQKEKQIKLSK
jgi:hypothetical protein